MEQLLKKYQFELTVNFEYSKTKLNKHLKSSLFELTVNFEYSKTLFV